MDKTSYRSIAQTSGLIGFVQLARMFFSLINSKVIALFIGPEGMGIYSLYSSFATMVDSFAALGTHQSGVRDIAKLRSDRPTAMRCIWVLRRIIFISSFIASLTSIVFSGAISLSLFGTRDYRWGVILVSTTILLNGISKGQVAILNGFRRIRELAKSQIIGAAIGSAGLVVSAMLLGSRGISLYIFIVSASATATTWWYVRGLALSPLRPSHDQTKSLAKSLIVSGLSFSSSALSNAIATYLSRIYLSSTFGLTGVGIYMASWTLSAVYVSLILSAMGVDFMPRIMATKDDNTKINILINNQMELGVLASCFGLVAMILFAPAILELLYSSEFRIGATIIRWQILGVALRVLTYPLSYVLICKNMAGAYTLTQVGLYIIELIFLIFIAQIWGFNALGINHFAAYSIYTISLIILLLRRQIFRPSPLLIRLFVIEWTLIAIALVISWLFSGFIQLILSVTLLAITLIINNKQLKKHMDIDVLEIIKNKFHLS